MTQLSRADGEESLALLAPGMIISKVEVTYALGLSTSAAT